MGDHTSECKPISIVRRVHADKLRWLCEARSCILLRGTTLYHTTSKENVDSIRQHGLRPFSEMKDYSSNQYQNDVDGVALATLDQVLVIKRQMEECGGTNVVYEAYLPRGTVVHEDTSMPESAVIVPRVPAKNLRLYTGMAPVEHASTNLQTWFESACRPSRFVYMCESTPA